MTKVFVYGTLRTGFGNNRLLQDGTCHLVKEDEIVGYNMYAMGGFPGITSTEIYETSVKGEVWEVGDDALVQLNRLEGFREPDSPANFYNRTTVVTESGEECLVYIQDTPPNNSLVESGDWVEHTKNYHR